MGQKLALIIATAEYQDTALARLAAPGLDAHDFAGALQSADIGGFDDVQVLLDQTEPVARRAVARFFGGRRPDDLLLLYFSGHGVRDEQGQLYLAVSDTDRSLLSATAIPANFINEQMNTSRSRRQVLILDCCNSGAFAQGSKGGLGGSMGIAAAFEGTGYGRVVLTATDATQYAWEGDEVLGEAANSVFTHYLVQGLETGAADADGDGRITLDELYDYVYEQVVTQTPRQTPRKFAYNQQGELVIAHNKRAAPRPVALPPELRQALESPLPGVREAVVVELDKLLRGSHRELASAALEALEALTHDDSRRVSSAAGAALAAHAAGQQAARAAAVRQEAAAAEKLLRARQQQAAEQRAAAEQAAAEKAAADKALAEKAAADKALAEKAAAEKVLAEKAAANLAAAQQAAAERAARRAAEQQAARAAAAQPVRADTTEPGSRPAVARPVAPLAGASANAPAPAPAGAAAHGAAPQARLPTWQAVVPWLTVTLIALGWGVASAVGYNVYDLMTDNLTFDGVGDIANKVNLLITFVGGGLAQFVGLAVLRRALRLARALGVWVVWSLLMLLLVALHWLLYSHFGWRAELLYGAVAYGVVPGLVVAWALWGRPRPSTLKPTLILMAAGAAALPLTVLVGESLGFAPFWFGVALGAIGAGAALWQLEKKSGERAVK